mgnify:CR=1 FL=1
MYQGKEDITIIKTDYTLLVVDDNQYIREAICDNINWNAAGIGRVLRAANGREAIDIIKDNAVDIVVTDVLMPVMDGVHLAREIRKNYPGIVIIFISAYDDFEYVQQAIKTDAFDYFLKPVDSEVLFKGVQAAIMEKELEVKLRHKIKSGQEFLTERFYRRLIEKKNGTLNMKDDADYLNITFKKQLYVCVVLDIDDKDRFKSVSSIEDFEMSILIIRELALTALADYETHIFNGDNDTVVILVGLDGYGQCNDLFFALEKMEIELEKRCHITLTAGIGNVRSKIEDIRYSYQEAKKAVEYRFLMGFGKVLPYQDFNGRAPADGAVNWQKHEEKVVKYLKLGRAEEFDKFLDEFISRIERLQTTRETLYAAVIGLAIKVYQTVNEQGASGETFSPAFIYRMYDELQKLQTKEQLLSWLRNTISAAFYEVETSRKNYSSGIINKILDFIERNYHMENLNLDLIAREVAFSPSYISLIFKKETGINLFDHITKLRIEKAMAMLRNSCLRISDIGEMVGYPNPSYFTNVFKKHTGKSPKEFRDQFL